MRMGAAFVVVGSCFSFGFANESRGITVIASPGAGPTPQAMAQAIANPSFGVAYVAGTASTLIEAAGSAERLGLLWPGDSQNAHLRKKRV